MRKILLALFTSVITPEIIKENLDAKAPTNEEMDADPIFEEVMGNICKGFAKNFTVWLIKNNYVPVKNNWQYTEPHFYNVFLPAEIKSTTELIELYIKTEENGK